MSTADSGVACMEAMGDTMQIYDVQLLGRQALALLLGRRGAGLTTGALAVALAVPFWVADVVMDAMQEQGDALHTPAGWCLSCSATVALALTLPASLAARQNRAMPGGAA